MTRVLLIISILSLNYFNSFSQIKNEGIDRMTISQSGDFLLTQTFELIIKRRKVYFITPVVSYLHVKGLKRKTLVKMTKKKREEIFNQVDQLDWTSFSQTKSKTAKDSYYTVQTYKADKLIDNFRVSEELLPLAFKKLYETIIGVR
jgi:hypothetical protein